MKRSWTRKNKTRWKEKMRMNGCFLSMTCLALTLTWVMRQTSKGRSRLASERIEMRSWESCRRSLSKVSTWDFSSGSTRYARAYGKQLQEIVKSISAISLNREQWWRPSSTFSPSWRMWSLSSKWNQSQISKTLNGKNRSDLLGKELRTLKARDAELIVELGKLTSLMNTWETSFTDSLSLLLRISTSSSYLLRSEKSPLSCSSVCQLMTIAVMFSRSSLVSAPHL